ncbi:alkene reductase [Tardiphaga sp. 804_B3_N1_9]|uniref:alkene reductase n=1 Tax=Tardiphaga sp. 804_B3_N1_9 TaxID=3240786 RepID=UPI003F22A34E
MTLFQPFKLGPFEIKNRIILAPLVRARSDEQRAPTDIVPIYYAQRASAGFLVTEGTHVSPYSVTRPFSSANYTNTQTAAWAKVVDAVHEQGGVIFQQLYHVGRKAIAEAMPNGVAPVAPSAIAAVGGVVTEAGLQSFSMPRSLELHEIPAIVEEFREAAKRAFAAGFDGIEILGANGFLIDQFLRDSTNLRGDAYGGPIANRARFLLEVVDSVSEIFGADRIGVRLSPHFRADHISDSDPVGTFTYVAAKLNERGIGYIHLLEGTERQTGPSVPLHIRLLDLKAASGPAGEDEFIAPHLRRVFDGPIILNGSYTRESAERVIEDGIADAVAFGRLFIANPDLPERFRLNAALNPVDVSTFYTGGPRGYIDYPTLQTSHATAPERRIG